MAHAIPASPLPRVENILFATDFSPISQAATPYACAIAKRFGATLYVVHVVGPKQMIGPLGAPYADVDREDEDARQQLTILTEQPPVKQIRHYATIHRGEVWDLVLHLASSWDIDLIVVGTHGRHGFKQLMLGSVAEQIFRRAACPVLTIGPAVPKHELPADRFTKILLATDFSAASVHVLHHALAIACANNSTLVLFHALTEEELKFNFGNLHDAFVDCNARLAALVPGNLGLNCEVVVKRGAPAELVVQSAGETQADLIVMGARRGATVAAHSPRAIAHIVVCEAPCPVLTVGH
jgi:nucleotide-binding universal stress UspA family protein